MNGMRVTTTTLAIATVVVLAGCGAGAGETPDDVQLRVSDDFGHEVLVDEPTPKLEGEDTVMRLLQRNAEVSVSGGGTFVDAIEGRAGGEGRDGSSAYWLFFRNGVFSDKGASEVRLRDGDRVWWDRNDSRAIPVGAVVGSFPAPFSHGVAGEPQPVGLECAPAAKAACATVTERLRQAGITAKASALRPTAAPPAPRILVGTWRDIRSDPVAVRLERGPKASGVPATPTTSGVREHATDGSVRATVRDGWGLIAATRAKREPPTWVVTGASAADVRRAADGLRERSLAGRFAVLYRGSTPRALPAEGP